MGVVSKKDCGVWSLLVRRLWCSFLAAPMFPMARVKEDTMTSRPEGGGGGGGEGGGADQRRWSRGRRSWRGRFNVDTERKKGNGSYWETVGPLVRSWMQKLQPGREKLSQCFSCAPTYCSLSMHTSHA